MSVKEKSNLDIWKVLIRVETIVTGLYKKLEVGNGQPSYFKIVDKNSRDIEEMKKNCFMHNKKFTAFLERQEARDKIDIYRKGEENAMTNAKNKKKGSGVTLEKVEHGIKDFAHLMEVVKKYIVVIATSAIASVIIILEAIKQLKPIISAWFVK